MSELNENVKYKEGKFGEEIIKEYLENDFCTVEDVSDDTEYWEKDIDFIVTDTLMDYKYTIDVKTCKRIHQTHNLFLETISNWEIDRKGWYQTSEADYIYYFDVFQNYIHVFGLQEMRELVTSGKIKTRTVNFFIGEGFGCAKEVQGLLVNVSQLSKLRSYQKIFIEGENKWKKEFTA